MNATDHDIDQAVSAYDSDALAATSVTGLSPGARAYVTSLTEFFTLKLSTAALVTDQVVEALGVTGYRWISDAIAPIVTSAATIATLTVSTLAKLPVASFHSFCTLGANASGGATHITATGVKVGDKVESVLNVTTPGSALASFEATVTVADQIQQSATDLSAKTLVIRVLAQS